MQLPQIRMQSQQALIGLKAQRGVQNISQSNADLTITQPMAEMTIKRIPSKLTIDQTKAREDVDLKSISKRIAEAAQAGVQELLNGIARRSQEGNELMSIENGGNPIAGQAKRNSAKDQAGFTIGWIPKHGSVEIDYDPGTVNIDVQVNKPLINANVNEPRISYTPGSVEVNLKQSQSLKIDFDNLRFIGVNYEQTI
ncbi:hypothetical protein D0469_12355 [Peribacillus saganii]|uniref:YviE n=1 Tax=Peribacillus saganii TaxID=2303992 RepID=A0A372LM70_9BACI|nr:DUF6470 family protein [Peribacillus saganii]RFU68299.1 hypothetical protein D0469_12355 [Peribacillus saganii]